MKKIVILVISIFLVTGCSRTIKCSNNEFSVDVRMKGKEVKTITAYFDYETKEEATSMCDVIKGIVTNKEDVVCKEKSIEVKNYEDNIDIENLTKDNIKSYFENNGFICE